jgi:hypothetical protein
MISAANSVKISEQRNEIARLLIAHGYTPSGSSQGGQGNLNSPIFYAVICDDVKLVNLFTMYGVKMQPRNPADIAATKLWKSRHPSLPLPVRDH